MQCLQRLSASIAGQLRTAFLPPYRGSPVAVGRVMCTQSVQVQAYSIEGKKGVRLRVNSSHVPSKHPWGIVTAGTATAGLTSCPCMHVPLQSWQGEQEWCTGPIGLLA